MEPRLLLSASVYRPARITVGPAVPAGLLVPAVAVPGQPTGVEALWEGSTILVDWTATSGATTYNIYRATTPGGEGSTPYVTGLTSNSYVDQNVTPGQSYEYEITAVNSGGESPRSAEVTAVTSVDVLSYHGSDLTSDGLNSQEQILTPGNVNPSIFGENFTTSISDTPNLDGIPTATLNTSINYTAPDGQAYGEPLVKTDVTISTGPYGGTVHDVVYVATELGSLYAIDANGGNILWKDSFIYNAGGNPNPLNPTIPNGTTAIPGGYNTETNSQDVSPWICIMGTPVIDTANNSIYLVTNTRFVAGGASGNQANPHYLYAIHKINLSNGQDTSSTFADTTLGYSNPSNPTYTYNSGPYTLGTGEGAITVSGQSRVYFNAVRQMVRPALEIYNGRIYLASASHGDNQPYHGWILTFDATSLALNGVFNTTPNGVEGGIWQGGDGVVFDAQGNFYVETGNGTFDGNYTTTNGVTTYTGINAQGFPSQGDYGDTFIKLALDPTTTQTSQGTNGWGIKVVDYFSPYNNQSLNNGDTDLGSGGPIILPASAGSAAHPNLIVGAGKQGTLYLLDTTNMGKFSATDARVVQEVGSAFSGSLSTPAYFNGRLYWSPGYGGDVDSWALTNAHIDTTSEQSTPDGIAFPGSSPYISANGTQNGIVWVIDKGTGELRAYNASNLATELWTSAMNPQRDGLPGGSIKFSVATPVNGRVYALSGTSLVAYGPPLPPTSGPNAPTNLTAAATASSTIVLSWTDNSNNEDGFAIEESTDGKNFTQIATVGVNVAQYTVSGLTPQATYYFRVRAYNSYQGQTYSAYTNIASATTPSSGTQLPVYLYHMDEGTGTTTVDSISGNNGTLVGSPLPAWVTPGRVGGANLSFSGNGTYEQSNESAVHVANDLSPVLGATSSLDVWVKTTQVGNATHWMAPAITGVEQSGAGNDINWGTLDASGDIGIFVGDSGGIYSTSPINNGQWHNVAITRNASTGVVQLYIDGKLNASGTFATGNLTSQFQMIGALQDDAGDGVTVQGANYFNGQIDELAIYNQVLTAGSVLALATAPAAPSNLVVTPASGTELDLTWTDNSTYATGYIVQRSVNNGPWVSLPELPAGTTGYNDTGLTPNTLYSYQVEAVDSAGASPFSNTASYTTPIPPTTPIDAHTTLISTTEIDLAWTNTANNATYIRILRSNIGGEFVVIVDHLSPTTTSYNDTGLTAGTEFDYHIQEYNIAGYSDFAGIHTGTIAAAPAGLTAAGSPLQISLTWTPPAYNGDAQDLTYNVYRGTTAGAESTTPIATGVTAPSFTDTQVTPGQTYYYTATAIDLGGESARSGEASAIVSAALPPYITASAGAAYDYNPATGALSLTSGTLTFTADAGTNPLVNLSASGSASKVIFNTSEHVLGLSLSSGAQATVLSLGAARTYSNHNVLVIGTLGAANDPTFSVDSSSKLDLTDNDLIVHSGTSDSTGNAAYTNVNAMAVEGRNPASGKPGSPDGQWNGNGLDSSAATSADAAAGYEKIALGVVLNSTLFVGPFSSWQVGSFNETLAASDIIVKYTYLGDYGLFGKVYDSDAAILQRDFDNGKTNTHTWATGSSLGDGLSDASEAGVFQFQYGLGTGGRFGPQL
jgi:fibronectin type 3 domain-containing protein